MPVILCFAAFVSTSADILRASRQLLEWLFPQGEGEDAEYQRGLYLGSPDGTPLFISAHNASGCRARQSHTDGFRTAHPVTRNFSRPLHLQLCHMVRSDVDLRTECDVSWCLRGADSMGTLGQAGSPARVEDAAGAEANLPTSPVSASPPAWSARCCEHRLSQPF